MGRLSKYDSSFKAKVAMEAMKERESKTHSKSLKSQQIIREN